MQNKKDETSQAESDESSLECPPIDPIGASTNITTEAARRFIYWGVYIATAFFIISAWLLLISGTIAPFIQDSHHSDNLISNVTPQYKTNSETTRNKSHQEDDKSSPTEDDKPHQEDDEHHLGSFNKIANYAKDNLSVINLLKLSDYLLISLTIFLAAYFLVDIKDVMSKEPEKGSIKLKKAIKSIDMSVLAMTTITLCITFLIYVLEHKNNNEEGSIFQIGIGLGIVIVAIALYIFLTNRTIKDTYDE